VFLDILFVEVRRIVREASRIVERLVGYADLPVFRQLARAGDDVERLLSALERISPLLVRAQIALATIRRPRYRPPVPNGSDASNGFSGD
jgi:hypothetical protein